MMSAAVVLAILVVAGESQKPELAALRDAAGDVAGGASAVRVIESPKVSDAEALRVEHDLDMTAVVQLTWCDGDRLLARLRLHAARTNRWIDREIRFARGDTARERGRALGFAIASMLPEGDPQLQIQLSGRADAPVGPPTPPPPQRHAVAASLAVGAGLGGPAGGVGGALGAETAVTERAAMGLRVGLRHGQLSDVEARSLTAVVACGATFRWRVPDETHALGLGARADALLLYHSISRAGPAGGTQSKGHLMPGADLLLEATWRLSRPVELVLDGGVEVAFGTVDVTVVAAPPAAGTATIPAVRAVANLGVRLRF
jgi:hypothetical protein